MKLDASQRLKSTRYMQKIGRFNVMFINQSWVHQKFFSSFFFSLFKDGSNDWPITQNFEHSKIKIAKFGDFEKISLI